MMTCPTCFEETPEARNFCIHCKHKVRDLRVVKFGAGCRHSPALDYFWESGEPAVFASKDALDYDPALAA